MNIPVEAVKATAKGAVEHLKENPADAASLAKVVQQVPLPGMDKDAAESFAKGLYDELTKSGFWKQ